MILDWIKIFLMSQGTARKLSKKMSWIKVIPVALFALLVVSVPERHLNSTSDLPMFISSLSSNMALLGAALTGIYLIISFVVYIAYRFRESFWHLLKRIVLSSSVILILNGALALLIFIVLEPLQLTQIALALTATLVSTYYVIVAITVVLPTERFSLPKQIVIELLSLALWYAFVFIVLPMTA